MAGEIFISYRRTRDVAAARLEGVLRESGFADYQIFRDVRGLFAGETFDHQLADTLRRTRVVLLLLGPGDAPGSAADDWISRELRAALISRKPIIPVALLPGGEQEATAQWPSEFRSILEMQFLSFSEEAPSSEVRRLCGALRRLGVRPLDTVQQWQSILHYNPVDEEIEQLTDFATTRRSGVALLRGAQGTGRSHIMDQVARRARCDGSRAVGLHMGLQSRLVGVDGAAMYDWIEGAVASEVLVPDCVLDLFRRGLKPQHLPRSIIDRLTPAQRRRLTDEHSNATQGMAQGSLDLLESLASTRPLVLMCDDIDLADSSTQEIVRVLADRLTGAQAPPIVLILAAATSSLLDLFVRDLPDLDLIDLRPDVSAMLRCSGLIDKSLIDELAAMELTPAQCAIYLQHLHEYELLVVKDGVYSAAPAPLPRLDSVLDDELNNVLPSSLQEILEIGALCGTRFPVGVADQVAGAGGDAGATMRRLLSYDQDHMIVLPEVGVGSNRVAFASSMWWQHLRARRLTSSGKPTESELTRALAEALADPAASTDDRYDDWATVGFLYDSIDDNAAAGAAFLRAARAARRDLANEAAARGYREAARRLELHAATSPPGAQRAGELFRVAYCLFRAATAVDPPPAHPADAPVRHESAGETETASTDPFAPMDAVLEAVDRELDAVASQVTATDFDDVVTHGSNVNSETVERLKLQWRSLSAYVAVERGRRALVESDYENAILAFSRALLFGEAGLSGSVYHELVVAASAGLSLAFSNGADVHGGERASAAVEHGARSAMIASRSPYAGQRAPGERDRFAEGTSWVSKSWDALATHLDEPSLRLPRSRCAPRETELIDFLRAAHRAVSPPNRIDHPDDVIRRCRVLIDQAVDLSDLRADRTLLRDVEIYAHSHDQFRYIAGARLLRLWRDLGGTDSQQLSAGAENDWRNPVLLHGRIAAQWLEHDLRVDRVVGEASFRRISAAMCSHTVGASTLGDGADAAFTRVVHLADMVSGAPNDADLDNIWSSALGPGGLASAYDKAYSLRAARLRDEGKIVSPASRASVESA